MQIGVSYGSITALQDNCNNTSTKITQIIEELNAQLQPLASSWTGTAYDAYQTDQQKWTQAQQDLSQVLQRIGQALGHANDQYQNAENKNTSMFAMKS